MTPCFEQAPCPVDKGRSPLAVPKALREGDARQKKVRGFPSPNPAGTWLSCLRVSRRPARFPLSDSAMRGVYAARGAALGMRGFETAASVFAIPGAAGRFSGVA